MSAGPILEFKGEHGFLSNFAASAIKVPQMPAIKGEPRMHPASGLVAATVEHAFQALKAANKPDALWVLQAPDAAIAKRRGSKRGEGDVRIALRPDWEAVKQDVMLACLRRKFDRFDRDTDPNLAKQLLATGYRMLVEGNTWGDQTWGATWVPELMTLDGETVPQKVWARRERTISGGVGVLVGDNWLGRLLALRRAELDCEVR